MKFIPNCLSICRVVLSLSLLFVTPWSRVFFITYIVCGFSDLMDGFIARKTGSVSQFGAKLDSFADLLMICVVFVIIFPVLELSGVILLWIAVIFVIRLASMAVAAYKYKTFASIHTYGNKITGIALFLIPMLFPFVDTMGLAYGTCILASISAIEELLIQVTSKQLELNRQSIFVLRKEKGIQK